MRINQEIKEITITPGKEFLNTSYPGAGFYNVNNKTHLAFTYFSGGALFVYVFPWNDILSIIDNEEPLNEITATAETTKGTVSESFALKALAIVLNKERFSELNPE